VGHIIAPELHYQEGSALSRGTRDNIGAPLSGRQSPKSWDTWQHRISHAELPSVEVRCCHMSHGSELCLPEGSSDAITCQQRGEVQGHRTRDSAEAHLSKETRFEAEGYMATAKLTSTRRRGPGSQDMWWLRGLPLQGGVVRSYSLRDNAWMHALLLILGTQYSSYRHSQLFIRANRFIFMHSTNQYVIITKKACSSFCHKITMNIQTTLNPSYTKG
jgi:hypothetical protein